MLCFEIFITNYFKILEVRGNLCSVSGVSVSAYINQKYVLQDLSHFHFLKVYFFLHILQDL